MEETKNVKEAVTTDEVLRWLGLCPESERPPRTLIMAAWLRGTTHVTPDEAALWAVDEAAKGVELLLRDLRRKLGGDHLPDATRSYLDAADSLAAAEFSRRFAEPLGLGDDADALSELRSGDYASPHAAKRWDEVREGLAARLAHWGPAYNRRAQEAVSRIAAIVDSPLSGAHAAAPEAVSEFARDASAHLQLMLVELPRRLADLEVTA